MKLEELARSSSTAARTAVAPLDPPTIGDSSRGPVWRPALAAAAVTAVVVGGLVVVDRGQDDPEPVSQPVSVPTEVDLPPLGVVSEHWIPVFATDGTVDDGTDTQQFDYYGDASADRPFETGDLLVAWGDLGDLSDGDIVAVRGVDGVLSTGDDVGLDADVTTLTWHDPAGPSVLLASRSADDRRLLEIATALVVDTIAGPLPESIELDLVATDFGTPFMAVRGAQAHASSVVYESADDSGATLLLTTRRSDLDAAVDATEWWLGAPDEIELATGTGYAFDLGQFLGGGEQGEFLMWSPSSGGVAQLLATGPDADVDLAAIVDEVVELDDEAWAALLLTQAAPATDAESFDVLFGEGGGEIDGESYGWAFGELDGQLCVNWSTGGGSSSSCQDMPARLPDGTPATTIDQGGIDRIATWVILADPSVGSIRVDDPDVTVDRVEANGWSWFVAVAADGTDPTFTAVSAGGDVIGAVEHGLPAVGVPADLSPVPELADHPSAVELGLDDMVVLASGDDGALTYWFGVEDGRPCIVTDGAAVTAGCSAPGDIVVFPPRQVDDGERSFVVLTGVPDCVSDTSSGSDITSMGSVSDGGDVVYEFVVGSGSAADWELGLIVGTDSVPLALPAEGTAPFPADLCP